MKQFGPTFFVSVNALAACVLCAACTGRVDATAATPSSTESRPAHSPARLAPCAPLLLAVFGDRTWSREKTATASISAEQLARVVAILRRCGGELAYGDIKGRGESFKPLTRLRVDAPPTEPSRTTIDDPFEQAKLDEMYARRISAYRKGLGLSRVQAEAAIARFLAGVQPRLEQPATANSSDVQSAVARALLFLDEPQVGWPTPPRRVAMLVSDVQHNTGKWTLDISGDITWLLVNGIGSRGTFPPAGATVFEGLDSAIRFIEDTGSGPTP